MYQGAEGKAYLHERGEVRMDSIPQVGERYSNGSASNLDLLRATRVSFHMRVCLPALVPASLMLSNAPSMHCATSYFFPALVKARNKQIHLLFHILQPSNDISIRSLARRPSSMSEVNHLHLMRSWPLFLFFVLFLNTLLQLK